MINVEKNLQILNSMPKIKASIDNTIKMEGDYVNNPDDPGGATRYGVTERTARRNGYKGDMRDLPMDFARAVYVEEYVIDPKFHLVNNIYHKVAEELIDTGINTGPGVPSKWLQRILNALNKKGSVYRDIATDGIIGNGTISALEAYRSYRSSKGEIVLLKYLDALQGEYYISLAEKDDRYETFAFGWAHRLENVERH